MSKKTQIVSHRIIMHHDGKTVIGGMYGESGGHNYLNLFDLLAFLNSKK